MRRFLVCVFVMFLVPLLVMGETERVSVASDGTQGNNSSDWPIISADGRYVAFGSYSDNLVPGDTNGTGDIFVHDRETGVTTMVSVASDGTQGNGYSALPSLSADGRYVAFMSYANNLVSGDTNGYPDVFVHDRQTGETTRVSVTSSGAQANNYSTIPKLSADGRYVAFRAYASNLVPGDTNGRIDIFVHDRVTGETTRVSVASNGTQANAHSNYPSISADGRCVAFYSDATNLVPGDTNWATDVFLHDRQTGETIRVSVASDGTQGDDSSGVSSISSDGRYVAFTSYASNLVPNDTNWSNDIFLHDRQTGETSMISVASDGTQGNCDSGYVSMSADVRYFAFNSCSTNLVSNDTNGWSSDIFLHDRQTGETSMISVASDGTQGNSSSGAYSSISADGKYVAFISNANNLVPGDTNGYVDVFVYSSSKTVTSATAINDYIQALPDQCFSGKADSQKKAFANKIAEIQAMIDTGYYQDAISAINKLSNDIRPKVDGDNKNAWITCPDAQDDLIAMVDSLIEYLQSNL